MYQSKATVIYGPEFRVIAQIDQGISDFYRSLIPKYFCAKPQKHRAHITIVRNKKEVPFCLENWGKYDSCVIDFEYHPCIHFDGTYFWLNAFSEDIGAIRESLGLSKYRDDRSYGGVMRNEYHITIANVKN